MFPPVRHALLRLCLTFALALATAGAGLAHRAPAPGEARLAAYTLAGGSIADLCGTAGHAEGMVCAFCQPQEAAEAPPAPAAWRADRWPLVSANAGRPAVAAPGRVLDPSRPLRGPPAA